MKIQFRKSYESSRVYGNSLIRRLTKYEPHPIGVVAVFLFCFYFLNGLFWLHTKVYIFFYILMTRMKAIQNKSVNVDKVD